MASSGINSAIETLQVLPVHEKLWEKNRQLFAVTNRVFQHETVRNRRESLNKAESSVMLSQRAATLAKTEALIQVNKEHIEVISQKEKAIAEGQAVIQVLKEQISKKDTELAEKDVYIQQLKVKNEEHIDKAVAERQVVIQALKEQISKKDTKLAEKDAHIQQLQEPTPENSLLLSPTDWIKSKNMPVKMGATIQSVVVGEAIYVGGGEASSNRDMCTVMKFDIQADLWTKLPLYSFKSFALTSNTDKLVVIGGVDPDSRKRTGQVAVFDSDKWIRPYPPMSTARNNFTAQLFNYHIIVAGGRNDEDKRIASVEIFDVKLRIWYSAEPLPIPRASIKSSLVGHNLYIMGGWDANDTPSSVVHCIHLEKLIDSARVKTSSPFALWMTIADTPVKRSTPLGVNSSLFAIGGRDDNDKPSSSIYCYQPHIKAWSRVGDLSSPRYYSTCSSLSSDKIFVAGGQSTFFSSILTHFLSTAEVLNLAGCIYAC